VGRQVETSLRDFNAGLAVLVAAVALVAPACSGGDGGDAQATEPVPTGEVAPNVVQPGAPGQPSQTLSEEELASIEPPTYTEADVAFMQGMIHHHAQALRMTSFVPKRSASGDIPLLAQRMELSQEAEIEQMQSWLKTRDEPAPKLHPVHGHAHGVGLGPTGRMPGMLNDAELLRLERAEGREFDRMFLQFMIRHHQGALTMVRQLYSAGGGLESEADLFARHVESDQEIEIARMRQLLARMA
jgi:uncharacterized protein (DUF305 family)